MNQRKPRSTTPQMRSLDEYSQRELVAYRRLGSVKQLRRLRYADMRRRERRRRFAKRIDAVLAGAILIAFAELMFFILCLWP